MRTRRTSPAARAAALALTAVLLAVPAGAEEWFDAYQRGLDALRQGKAARAVEQFERAIKLRPDPGANLITYGTNRLDRYYPYLHLAEAHLMAGQLDLARVALERSQARGREPAGERGRLTAQIEHAQASTRVAERPPTPTTLTAAPAAAPAPSPSPPAAVAAPPLPSPAASVAAPMVPVATARPQLRPTPSPLPPVREGVPATAPPAPESAHVSSILVVSDPGGASVYLDDEEVGRTDAETGRLVKTGVAPGAHRVRLSREGFADALQEVRLAEGVPASVRAALRPLPQWGSRAAILGMVVVLGLALAAGVWAWRRRAPVAVDGGTVTLSGQRSGGTPPDRTGPTVPRPSRVGETVALAGAAGAAAQFGTYDLVEVLGKGGMATVFKARRGGETFALKRPLAAYLDEPEFLERFLREAEIGRTLHHPNIIRIFERGEVEGVPYFTMELVEGETLSASVRRRGALTPRAAARIVAQVAEALDYAHLKGVVHRDLKPSNIMLLADGTVKVMDYGIARARRFEGLTVTGAFLGTPDYVAPEAVEGKSVDGRSDLYSLGVLFYEIVTGQKPFVGDTPFATLRKHCTEPPTPPSTLAPGLGADLEAIILRLLRKDPDERYPGAEELLIELRDYLNRAPLIVSP